MSRENPPSDPATRYYRNSWVSGGDRFWSCPGESYFCNLPLIISMSGYSRWVRGNSFTRTNSQTFSIELVLSGDVIFTQRGRSYTVNSGQVFFVHRDCDNTFATGPSGLLHKRMATIDGIVLKIVLQSLGLLDCDVITCRDPGRLARLIKCANRIAGEASAEAPWRLSQLAYEILLEVAHNSIETSYPPEVTHAISYMNANINRALTLDEISRVSGASMYHFARLFRRTLRCPPMTFFAQRKMAFAKNLLKDSELRIKEIALLLGYDDPLYFSAQFRKSEGMSPRRYRRGVRGEEVSG